jgi:hypothetical protein
VILWCHTWGCPNYGRPRETLRLRCPYCGAERKADPTNDHAMDTAPETAA